MRRRPRSHDGLPAARGLRSSIPNHVDDAIDPGCDGGPIAAPASIKASGRPRKRRAQSSSSEQELTVSGDDERDQSQTFEVPLDSRSAGLLTARPDILGRASDGWTVPALAPTPVRDMLGIARALFIHGAFVYEFFAVASAWSVIAVELALRDVLEAGERIPFRALIKRAAEAEFLAKREAEVIDAGAQLRNRWFHGQGPMAITPGMAQELLAASHLLVSRLYSPQSGS